MGGCVENYICKKCGSSRFFIEQWYKERAYFDTKENDYYETCNVIDEKKERAFCEKCGTEALYNNVNKVEGL